MEKIKQDEQRNDSSNSVKRKNRIRRLKTERMLLYESFVDGKITKREYLEKREKLANEINELEDAEKKIEDQNLKEHQIDDTMKKYLSYGDCLFEIGMTKELADVFIDTIYVHDTKRIEIVFTFTDFLKDAKKYLQEKETMVCNVRKEA